MAHLDHLQEAALREVIWTLGGSTRRLEAAFGGARGLLRFEDFVHGLQTIGFLAEDLEGCGFKDPAEAFRVLDRSGRGCLLMEEVTRRPDAKIRKLCGRSATLRRSASIDAMDMSIGSTGSDLYSAREELDHILGLLREREQEMQLLRTEMNLKEEDSHGAAEMHGARQDLTFRHRASMERLQESRHSNEVEEHAHSAEAQHLNEKSMQSSEKLLLEEQDCLRMEVSRQHCLRVIQEVEESVQKYRLRYQDSVAYMRSLEEAHDQLEVHKANFKPSQGVALRHELRVESEELKILESQQEMEEAQETELRNDLSQLIQELRQRSDYHRQELLTTVALGVSELSEELASQQHKSKSELDAAEKKLTTLRSTAKAKAAELQAIKERMQEARLSTETESKAISQRSKEQVQKTRAEIHLRSRELQEELLQLRDSLECSESGRTPSRSRENLTERRAQSLRQTQLQDLQEKRQEHEDQCASELRAELQAARERANNLASKCEQTWKKLTLEKRTAAELAAESCEAVQLQFAQRSQPYTKFT